jgi:DNA-binding Lrp family transcriptional regulator
MLTIVRVKTADKGDELWDHITENHTDLEKKFKKLHGSIQLVYISKRARHEDTSLFIHTNQPSMLGDFIAEAIAPIKGVEKIWMLNLMNMRFFVLPECLREECQRFIVNIRAYPNKVVDIYKSLIKLAPDPDAAPQYVAYTFHLQADNMMFSVAAKDKESAERFVEEKVKVLPGVIKTNVTRISKQERLASSEVWKDYVTAPLLPET